MQYRMAEIDIAGFLAEGVLAPLELSAEDDGLALVFRDGDALVGFEMRERADLPARAGIDPAALLGAETVQAALTERLRKTWRVGAGTVPKVTVAICTKDRPHWVSRLLDSLLPICNAAAIEILIVDNAPSDDRTRDLIAGIESVRYVRELPAGLDFARNRAVLEATGDVLAFLDDDVVVDRHWLAGLQRAWADNPDAGAVTGLILPKALESEAQILFERRGGFRCGFRPVRYGATKFRDWLYPCGAGRFGAGANMSFRRDLVRDLGGFDEALDTGRPLPGGGDLDIFYRVVRSGAPLIYEPQMAVYHEHRREMEALHRQYYTWGLGFGAFVIKSMRADPAMRKNFRKAILWWVHYQFGRIGALIAGKETTPARMIWAEMKGGMVGFFGEYDRSVRRSAAIKASVQ
jgi:GT2 family glycosyltransferase